MRVKINGMEVAGVYIGEPAEEGTFLDKINDFSEWAVHKELEIIFKPLVEALIQGAKVLIEATHAHLPEIAGCLTLLFGILIMIGMDFPKWFTRYGILMTGVVTWHVFGQ
jgi:hypothetical protein